MIYKPCLVVNWNPVLVVRSACERPNSFVLSPVSLSVPASLPILIVECPSLPPPPPRV